VRQADTFNLRKFLTEGQLEKNLQEVDINLDDKEQSVVDDNKVLGKKPTDQDAYNQWMTKLGHIADELHHLYMAPLEAVVKKFVKDPTKAKKVASGIFHVIVATFLIASGATAVKALQAKNLSLATLEGALSAVKGGEIKQFISGLFSA